MSIKMRFVLWAIATVSIFILFQTLQNAAMAPSAVPYSTFQENIEKVKEIRLLNNDRTFYFKTEGDTHVFQSVFPPNTQSTVVNALIANKVVVNVDPPSEPSIWGSIIFTFLPIILLIGAMVYIYRRTMSGTGASIMSVGSSPARLINPETNDVKLADVAGNPGDFDEVYEVIDFLKDPIKYQNAHAKLPHGILMYGPPGVGKTLLARAIAGEAGVPFFTISGSDFVEMFVGVGASRVRDMFKQLRLAQPAILFIDEIDTVGAHRGGGVMGGHREADQTLNQLLTEMDGFNSTNDSIMVIAATNRPEMLDPALLRPGRFDRKIPLNLPDINAREKILTVHVRDHELAEDVNLRTIAKGTPGMSGADLANLVNEAAMIIGKQNKTVITMGDLQAARDKIFMGRAKSLAMNEAEKKMTAYHEAGHAIAAYFTAEHDPVYKISIIPRDFALGVTMYLPDEDKYSISKTKLLSNLVSLMGGRAAEEVQFGENNISTGASNDLEHATDIARNMVTRWGFGETTGLMNSSIDSEDPFLLSDKTKEQTDEEIKKILNNAYVQAKSTLLNNKAALDKVSAVLLEKETIDDDEFKAIMEAFKPAA